MDYNLVKEIYDGNREQFSPPKPPSAGALQQLDKAMIAILRNVTMNIKKIIFSWLLLYIDKGDENYSEMSLADDYRVSLKIFTLCIVFSLVACVFLTLLMLYVFPRIGENNNWENSLYQWVIITLVLGYYAITYYLIIKYYRFVTKEILGMGKDNKDTEDQKTLKGRWFISLLGCLVIVLPSLYYSLPYLTNKIIKSFKWLEMKNYEEFSLTINIYFFGLLWLMLFETIFIVVGYMALKSIFFDDKLYKEKA